VIFAPSGTKDNEISLTEVGKELYLNLLTYMTTPVGENQSLPATENLAVTVDLKDVTLSWDAVSGALAYNIYVNDVLHGDSITATNYTVTGLDDALYKFDVYAIDSNGVDSENRATVRATVYTFAPGPVVIFARVSKNNVTIQWPSMQNAIAYKVYKDDVEIADSVTTVSYVDEGLENGTYVYSVASVNKFSVVDLGPARKEVGVNFTPTSVQGLTLKEISVYPNPFETELFINKNIEITSLKVFDITGQQVSHEFNNNRLTMPDFGSGLYFILINNEFIVKVTKK